MSPGKRATTAGAPNKPPPRSPGKRTLTQHLKGPPPAVRAALATECGTSLPDAAGWSKKIGADVSHARIVTGAKAAEATAEIGVPAFTVGDRVFLGDGVHTEDDVILRHELTHVAQQRGATMVAIDDLEMTSAGDHAEHQAHAVASGAAARQDIAPTGTMQIAPWIGGPRGGAGGFVSGPRDPQIDPFKYFENYGKRHFKELVDLAMGDMTLETGSPYATWAHGDSKTFRARLANDLATTNVPAKPYDLAEQTLAPTSVTTLIDTGRDADNKDDRVQGNEYHLGVTLELQKAYRVRLRESLARMVPRLIREWNRRTLADWAERNKSSTIRIPEHPETNQPGVGLLQSHPIDRFVAAALWGLVDPALEPDFAAYRKAFPEEAKPNGPRDSKSATDQLRPVKFEWQYTKNARRWIKVTDPIDASPEEVAKELFGSSLKTYLVTAAAPLFGLDMAKDMLEEPYESQHYKQVGDPKQDPGSSVENQILVGPLANDAALNQAAKFTAGNAKPAAVLQQFDLLIDELRNVARNETFALKTKEVAITVTRIEKRKSEVAAANQTDKWNAQVREQLDIAAKCNESLGILSKLYATYEAQEAKNLAWEIGVDYVDAAINSDLVVTARQKLDRANQRFLAFPTDWIEAQFRWIRRAILASRKNAKTGADDPFARSLDQKETKLRMDLLTVRNKLFTDPLGADADVKRITKELQDLATGAAAVRSIDQCNEAFVELKGAESNTGWLRSLVSNPVTGNHGNDRLKALEKRADDFATEWKIILWKWQLGQKDEAANELKQKAATKEWNEFFTDVAKEIRDQAKYDAWMTFAILVGIAIVTGFAGAALEPLAAASLGPILGFVVTATTEAAMFTTMSYFLVERHPTLQGFKTEFGKNVIVFGVLKGISKLFAGMEKLLAVELKELEMITQFATVNGIALHEANKEKARRGDTLTEGEILKISFDNLIFMIAVAIGGKALAPALGRWRVKGEVGKGLQEIQTLHSEVMRLHEAAKTTKDKAIGEKLLQRQRALLTAEREYLESLLELTHKGRDAALKKGMTADQYDALMRAQKDLGDATRGLREAEIMAQLEPVTQGQYLIEPGKSFDDAHKHFAETHPKGTSKVTGAEGTRTFEVALPDGSKLRISERAGKVGEVSTDTKTVHTATGDVPPRAEEVAKAHQVSDAAALKAFEALYKAHPKEMLAFLEAMKSQPGLANKLLSMFGEHTLAHVDLATNLGVDGFKIAIHLPDATLIRFLALEPKIRQRLARSKPETIKILLEDPKTVFDHLPFEQPAMLDKLAAMDKSVRADLMHKISALPTIKLQDLVSLAPGELAELAKLDAALLEKLAARGISTVKTFGQALGRVPHWPENAKIGLSKIAADAGLDAARILGKVRPNIEIEGMNTWVTLASRQLHSPGQLLDLEASLDKALQLRHFDPNLAMEVDYYRGKRVTRDGREAARRAPDWEKRKHFNIDVETNMERWEMKRVNPTITDPEKFLHQIKEGATKYTGIGIPSKANGGTKSNFVDVDFGNRLQVRVLYSEAAIRAKIETYIRDTPDVRQHVDAIIVHVELPTGHVDIQVDVR